MGINNKNYSTGSTETIIQNNQTVVDSKSRAVNMAKVYLYLALQLLITGAVAFGVGAIFGWWLSVDRAAATTTLNTIMIISAIVCICLCFGLAFALGKGKMVKPLVFTYNVLMGILISTFTIYVDWRILGVAFAITTAILAVDGIIGLFCKSNLNWIAFAAMALIFGAGICALITWPFALFMTTYNPAMVSFVWAIDMIMFVAINLIMLVDIVRMNKIAENGPLDSNLAMFCAFSIYVDFIYIFIKIVTIIAINSKR